MSALPADAGELRDRLSVLTFAEISPGTWEWTVSRRTWGQVTLTNKTNIFSKVGIGARDAQITVRRQELSLGDALLWRNKHLFLTSVADANRGHLQVSAALTDPVACLAERTESAVGAAGRPVSKQAMSVTFPGILTEKYARYEREETHAENDTSYVLVTPKQVSLRAGDVVTVLAGDAKAVYNVTVCHVLDEFKNEYEIAWRQDV